MATRAKGTDGAYPQRPLQGNRVSMDTRDRGKGMSSPLVNSWEPLKWVGPPTRGAVGVGLVDADSLGV
jgi:hypothetical protein